MKAVKESTDDVGGKRKMISAGCMGRHRAKTACRSITLLLAVSLPFVFFKKAGVLKRNFIVPLTLRRKETTVY